MNPSQENDVIREKLAKAFRALAWYGFQEGVANHVSAIAPAKSGNGEVILFIPDGVLWQDATPDILLGVDSKSGKLVEGNNTTVNDISMAVHMPIYERRPDVKAVIHSHAKYATTLSCLEDPTLLNIHQNSTYFHNAIAYDTQYDGISTSENEEGKRLAQSLGEKDVLLMGNHGLLVAAPSVAITFYMMFYMERACETQITAMSTGRPLRIIPNEVAAKTRDFFIETAQADAEKHLDAAARLADGHYKQNEQCL
uniref:Class II aldolase/adducin N-terminal domain-containing protein n=1 Tax=Ciona savignyi TaxID=51511 RepID=H2ZAQ4_CIOSA